MNLENVKCSEMHFNIATWFGQFIGVLFFWICVTGCGKRDIPTHSALPIVLAVWDGDLAKVNKILSIDPSTALAKDSRGISVGMWAVLRNEPKILESLLDACCPADGDGSGGNKLLFQSLNGGGKGMTPIVRILLEHGADPNQKNDKGVAPIVVAENLAHVRLLVEHGASLDPVRHQLDLTPTELAELRYGKDAFYHQLASTEEWRSRKISIAKDKLDYLKSVIERKEELQPDQIDN